MNADADRITSLVAKNVITVLKNENKALLKLKKASRGKILYVGVGLSEENTIAKRLENDYGATFIAVDGTTVIPQTDIDNWVKNYSTVWLACMLIAIRL